jgi:IS5 family transposase
MEKVASWQRLIETIEPFYPRGLRGRPPIGLERMLRLYFLQQWYGLAVEAVPGATTLMKFRHRLEKHELTRKLFDEIGIMLCERGLLMREVTIVEAPSSHEERRAQPGPRDAPDQERQHVAL